MIDLNELCKVTLANAEKRHANGGNITTETRKMLKHCATEVVEAMEAWTNFSLLDYCEIKDKAENKTFDYFDDCDSHSCKKQFESELADIICCVLIIAGKENIDIEKAINDCIEKNRKRAEKIGDKL